MVEEGGDDIAPDASPKIDNRTDATSIPSNDDAGRHSGAIPAPKKISIVRSSKTNMVNMQGMLGKQEQTGSMPVVDIRQGGAAAAKAATGAPSAPAPATTMLPGESAKQGEGEGTVKDVTLPRPGAEGADRYAPEFFGAYARETRKPRSRAALPQPDKPMLPPQAPPQFLDDETNAAAFGEDSSAMFGNAAKYSGAPISILTNRAHIAKKPRQGFPVFQFIKDNVVLSVLVLALVLVSATVFYVQREHKSTTSAPIDLNFLSGGLTLQELQSEVQQAITNQKYDTALAAANAFVLKNPREAEGFHERGRLFLAMHRYQDAADSLRTASSFNPRNKDILIDRAAAMYYLEDYDKACLEYDNIIQLDPQDAFVYFGKGLCEIKLKQQEPAIKDFKKAIELNPEYPAPHNALGDIHSEQGLTKQAYEDFSNAIRLAEQMGAKAKSSDNAKYYFNRGNASRHDLNNAKAVVDYSKAIQLNSELPEYFNNRGLSFLDEKNYADAAADFSSALKLDPNYTGAQRNLSIAQEHLKN